MKIRLKYRIYPNKEQQQSLAQLFGCCRFVYNLLLAENNARYGIYTVTGVKSDYPPISQFDLINRLSELKQSSQYPWLYDVCAQSLQQTCGHLANAFKGMFKHGKRFPKFKKRTNEQKASFTNQSARIISGALRLTNVFDLIKVQWDKRGIPQQYTGVTISKTPSGKYFASFIIETDKVLTNGVGTLGIDVGITDLYTFSDGTTIPNPRHFVKSQRKLARLQRSHSRKKKSSKNREKARIRVAKCHDRITNLRNDYLHKLTTRLVRENQAIGIERLNVKGMIRNRRLAKHIADASWHRFREMLQYKAALSTGCKIYLADSFFPSTQICSECGAKAPEKLKLGTRAWLCIPCGTFHQRDHNAALNLKALAERMRDIWKDRPESVILTPAYA